MKITMVKFDGEHLMATVEKDDGATEDVSLEFGLGELLRTDPICQGIINRSPGSGNCYQFDLLDRRTGITHGFFIFPGRKPIEKSKELSDKPITETGFFRRFFKKFSKK
jgi:hypothetical protein